MKGPGLAEVILAATGAALGGLLVRAILKKPSRVPRGGRSSRSYEPESPSGWAPGAAPALASLLASIDRVYPSRSRTADGILPSAAHHATNPNSDHERGDALDVTLDLRDGPDLDQLADLLLADDRVTYVIWNRRIANRTPSTTGEHRWAAGEWRAYPTAWMVEHGSPNVDPHTSHLHVSIDHARRDDASTWRVPMGEPVPSGYGNMPNARVTPELAAWAKALLVDPTFRMGQVRTRTVDGRSVAARAEAHPPSASIDHPHRGVSLYERA